MRAAIHRDSGVAHVRLCGDFTFAERQVFVSAHYPLLDDDAICVLHVDMHEVTLIDSAGLGMLLVLGDRARRRRKWVALSNARGSVGALFQLASMPRRIAVVPETGRLEDLWRKH